MVDAPSTTRVGPVVVIDNYDSFTYNLCQVRGARCRSNAGGPCFQPRGSRGDLCATSPRSSLISLPSCLSPAQYLGDLGCDYTVLANDARTVEEIAATRPAGVLISPGPGRPEDSGISLAAVRELGAAGVPIFGVCMGLQCIGQVYGARIVRAPGGVMHGKTSPVLHRGDDPLLRGLPSPFLAARYHSLVIDRESCPPDLDITAWCDDGTIMAARSKAHPAVAGVQFHPESIITDNGKLIVQNWVQSLQG